MDVSNDAQLRLVMRNEHKRFTPENSAGLVIVMTVSVPLGIHIGALTREGRRRRLESEPTL